MDTITTTGWRNEHPYADVPAWFERHCEDHSWRNDACPFFQYGRYVVFVDYAEPEQSEFYNERLRGEQKRFEVIAGNAMQRNFAAYKDGPLFATDSPGEIVAWLVAASRPGLSVA